MSFGATAANDLAKLIFWGQAIPGLADNAQTGALGNLYMSLHTADPGANGNQSSNECNYGGYQRIAIVRSNAGWAITGNVVSPLSTNEFPEMTSGAEQTATHLCIGTAQTGTGKVLARMTLTPNILCAVGTVPRIRSTTTLTFVV